MQKEGKMQVYMILKKKIPYLKDNRTLLFSTFNSM